MVNPRYQTENDGAKAKEGDTKRQIPKIVLATSFYQRLQGRAETKLEVERPIRQIKLVIAPKKDK